MILIKIRTSPSGEYAALWATIAYAKFQHRAINNIPHALGSVGEMVWTAERMYAQARSLVPNEEGTFDLGKRMDSGTSPIKSCLDLYLEAVSAG